MSLRKSIRNWFSSRRNPIQNQRKTRSPRKTRLLLENLEDRVVPAFTLNPFVWTPIGPTGMTNGQTPGNLLVSGRIAALAADPTDATGNTIFIAAAGGGVWKTTDGGTTW